MKMVLKVLLAALLSMSCHTKSETSTTDHDFGGEWVVYRFFWDGTPSGTTYVKIVQSGNEVAFIEDSLQIGTGHLLNDTLFCSSNMWDGGTYRIDIIHVDTLRTKTPACEMSGPSVLIRQK